jgi:Winged helix-turn-helix DNA-binding
VARVDALCNLQASERERLTHSSPVAAAMRSRHMATARVWAGPVPGGVRGPGEARPARGLFRPGMIGGASLGLGLYARARLVADLVDRIRTELDARIRELRPVVRELERLERAAAALTRAGARSVPGLRSRVGGARAAPGAARVPAEAGGADRSTAKPGRGRAARRRGRPAPRGQTRGKVLEALAAEPGSGSAAVAKASGISPSVAAATISRLVKQGQVRRLDQGGYAVVEPPSDERREAPAGARSGEGATIRTSPAEPPGQPPAARDE